VTSRIGLSLAIGAFIAGLVLSESVYSHQILAEVLPFRDTFNAIFFISVGMLLNIPAIAEYWPASVGIALLVLSGKALILLAILMLSKTTFRIAWITAFCLAQVGEFSLLLAEQAQEYQLLPESLSQLLLSSSVLTMILTPFTILLAGPIGLKIQKLLKEPTELKAADKETLKDHLIIVGFGLNGRNLASVVRDIGIQFVVIELSDKLVKEAKKENVPFIFGDAQ
jgi:CPA2 family monovalent cation:H+ antiporter-2